MKITAITCTADRPEAFALCNNYIGRQRRAPDQWIIMQDPVKTMPEKVLDALPQVKGDAIVFIEDDDWYDPEWIWWLEPKLENFELVGEGMALYYHVRQRWWSCCENRRHASLCQTAMRSELIPKLRTVIENFDNPFFDTRIWRLECRKHLALPKFDHLHYPNEAKGTDKRRVIGIKGMPGRMGYSGEHRKEQPEAVNADPSLKKLWSLIGQDAAAYTPFYERS